MTSETVKTNTNKELVDFYISSSKKHSFIAKQKDLMTSKLEVTTFRAIIFYVTSFRVTSVAICVISWLSKPPA